jgi:hypothetical protein
MWRQTSEGWLALGFLLMVLFFCGWIVRSAFWRAEPSHRPTKGWRLFWTVMGVLSVFGIFGSVLDMLKPRTFKHLVEVNGMSIPIDDCLVGSKEMLPDVKERTEFCSCMANNIGSSDDLAKDQRARLERGHMDAVIADIMKGEDPLKEVLAKCFDQKNLVVTDGIVESAREQCLVRMQADTAYKLYDIEKYCDCAMKQLVSAGFDWNDSTSLRNKVEAECLEQSKR